MHEILPGVFALEERALWLPDERVLAAGDLHLGYEARHHAGGAPIPAVQAARTLALLQGVIAKHRPEVLVLNGDVKHGFRRLLPEAQEVSRVLGVLAEQTRLVVIEGNHDGQLARMLPDGVPFVSEHLTPGGAWFTHGHLATARPTGTKLAVVSHEHPSLGIRDEVGITFRYPAFLASPDASTVVLPALSAWAAGVDVLGITRFHGPAVAALSPGGFEATAVTEAGLLPFGRVDRLRGVLGR